MRILYVEVPDPNEKATHIKVVVCDREKRVILSVDPVVIRGNRIKQAFDLGSTRRGREVIAEMPRLAPKQFKALCDLVESHLRGRELETFPWSMIREAATEAGVTAPEDGPLVIDRG